MVDEVKQSNTVHSEVIEGKEKLVVTAGGTVIDHGLHRALKQRHMQMIALGGVIGCVQVCIVGALLTSSV